MELSLDEPETNIGRVLRRRVVKYDGQTLCVAPDGDAAYEIGNYLGGGAAAVVYEALKLSTHERFAVKIVNPTAFRLMPSTALQRCAVASRGAPLEAAVSAGKEPVRALRCGTGAFCVASLNTACPAAPSPPGVRPLARCVTSRRWCVVDVQMRFEHVWWLVNLATKQIIAAYEDARFGTLREMTLNRCVDVWGWNPPEAAETNGNDTSPVPGARPFRSRRAAAPAR